MTCWIEINCAALRHNFAAICNLVGETRVIAIIKANAYGCGALECARIFAGEGAAMLAVTRVEEAVPLRESGVPTPILLLSPAQPDELETVARWDLTATVESFEAAQQLDAVAAKLGQRAAVHLKINTGMNRFGAAPDTAGDIARRVRSLQNVRLEGAFTHFADAAAPDAMPTQKQFDEFSNATFGLKDLTLHVANSAATLRFPAMRLDAVRPGTLLFGQYPAPELAKLADLQLRDPFAAQARVVTVREVKRGEKFGYGGEWTAPRDATLAILAIGWADGLAMEPRARPETPLQAVRSGLERAARLQKNPSSGRTVTIRGQRAPIVGRIAMQTCAVDVSKIEGIALGDIATVPMRRLAAGQNLARVYVD